MGENRGWIARRRSQFGLCAESASAGGKRCAGWCGRQDRAGPRPPARPLKRSPAQRNDAETANLPGLGPGWNRHGSGAPGRTRGGGKPPVATAVRTRALAGPEHAAGWPRKHGVRVARGMPQESPTMCGRPRRLTRCDGWERRIAGMAGERIEAVSGTFPVKGSSHLNNSGEGRAGWPGRMWRIRQRGSRKKRRERKASLAQEPGTSQGARLKAEGVRARLAFFSQSDAHHREMNRRRKAGPVK